MSASSTVPRAGCVALNDTFHPSTTPGPAGSFASPAQGTVLVVPALSKASLSGRESLAGRMRREDEGEDRSLGMTPMPLNLWSHRRAPGRAEDTLVHADALYNLARYLTKDPSEAEDLVQETYVRALRAWNEFVPGTNVKAWLFRILRNAFITRYRQERRHPAPAPYDTTEQSAEEEPAEPGSRRGGVEPEQMRRVVSGEIEAALRTLSEDARTVILLDLEGFTESEVAVVVGCAVGTVKSRLNRARAALRLRLADYGTGERS
jgi:RNA polymerase sigma-70 factor, ECF subfamily